MSLWLLTYMVLPHNYTFLKFKTVSKFCGDFIYLKKEDGDNIAKWCMDLLHCSSMTPCMLGWYSWLCSLVCSSVRKWLFPLHSLFMIIATLAGFGVTSGCVCTFHGLWAPCSVRSVTGIHGCNKSRCMNGPMVCMDPQWISKTVFISLSLAC